MMARKRKPPRGIYLRGKTWWMDFVTPAGRRIQESTRTRDVELASQLLTLRRDQESRSDLGLRPNDPSTHRMLTDYIAFARMHKAPSTVKEDIRRLNRFTTWLGKSDLDRITPEDIRRYIAWRMSDEGGHLGKALSKSGMQRELDVIRAAFRWGEQNGFVDRNPFHKIKRFRREKDGQRIEYLPLSRIRDLIEEAAQPVMLHGPGKKGNGKTRPRKTPTHIMIAIAAYCGLRLGELLHLRWEDIDLFARVLWVRNRAEYKNKDRKDRSVPIPKALIALLGPFHREHDSPTSGLVFQTRTGRPISNRAALTELKAAAKRAKIPVEEVSWNILRHSFATAWVSQGKSIFDVSKMLGHSSVEVTEQHYAGFAPHRIQSDADEVFDAPAPIRRIDEAAGA